MKSSTKRILLNFVIEIGLYAILLLIYFTLVLRYLGEPLQRLFNLNLNIYAIVTLLLILAQSVLLEKVTSFFVSWLGLERLE